MRRRTLAIGFLILLSSVVPSRVGAQENDQEVTATSPAPGSSSIDGWAFSFDPYIWLPEIHGSAQIRRVSASFNVNFDKVLDLIGNGDLLAGMGHFEAQRGRLSLFVDAVGGHATPSGEFHNAKVDSTLNFAYVEFGPAFRVLEMPSWVASRRPIVIDALTGGRFMYFYTKLSLTGERGFLNPSDSTSLDWVDPFVGGRWVVPLVGDLDLFFRGDIGGFGAGSQLAWNIVTGFEYTLPWKLGSATTRAIAGYKVLDFDYRTGSGSSRRSVDMNQRGPGLGISFNF